MGKLCLVLMIFLRHSKKELLALAPYPVAAALSVLCPRGDYRWLSSTDTVALPPSVSPRFELATMGGAQGTRSEDRENGGGVNLAGL